MCSTLDPIYALATPFRANELKSASKKLLVQPPSYDRIAIESMWRHCSRNRMRTNRRRPLVLNDLISEAVVENDSQSENGVTAPKKSRFDVSENCKEDVAVTICISDADKPGGALESGNSELTGRNCSSNDNNHSSNNFNSNIVASESSSLSSGQTQYCDSSIQAVCDNTYQAVDGSLKVEDCWWNNVDSQTWLQGLQSYLLLHSAVDGELHQMPVTVLPSTARRYSMTANPVIHHQAALSVSVESAVTEREHQYARQVLTPITGYRLSANGVLSAVPIYYFPVVNYSACTGTLASTVGCQQTYIGGRQSSLAAVDLVSFMHNYCLPPTSIPQSSVNQNVVATSCNAASQHLVSSLVKSSDKGPGSQLMMAGGATSGELSVPSLPQQTENSHSNSRPMASEAFTSDATGVLMNSSVCLTPSSLSGSSSAESWIDDASEPSASSSAVAVSSDESNVDTNTSTSSLWSTATDLTVPGWFGKGLGIKRSKRRLSRQS